MTRPLAHPGRVHPSAPAPAPARRAERRESGETLMESLISILLVGSTVVAMLGTAIALASATGVNRKLVRTGIAVVDAAERNIELASYHPCGSGAPTSQALLQQYRNDITIVVPGYTVDLVGVRVATARTGTATQPVDFGSCTGQDNGLQEVTVRASSTRGPKVTHNLIFYKRDTSCPSGYVPLFAQQPC